MMKECHCIDDLNEWSRHLGNGQSIHLFLHSEGQSGVPLGRFPEPFWNRYPRERHGPCHATVILGTYIRILGKSHDLWVAKIIIM